MARILHQELENQLTTDLVPIQADLHLHLVPIQAEEHLHLVPIQAGLLLHQLGPIQTDGQPAALVPIQGAATIEPPWLKMQVPILQAPQVPILQGRGLEPAWMLGPIQQSLRASGYT